MNKIQIYVHEENSREPKLLEVPENASIEQIIIDLKKGQGGEEIEIFLENQEDPLEKKDSIEKAGIGKRSHIHCHRCKKIAVTIFYNGEDKSLSFPPSATAKNILKKAIRAFGINESDAGDYLLKLDDKTILQPSDHIGSFSTYPHCQVKLFLTPTKPVQG